jgi:putative PIN family toxin of toxin-antitoxin system
MRRVVLDPNVLVSAYISPKGAPARLLELVLSERLQLVISPRLVAELKDVLRQGRTLERYREPARVEAFLAAIQTTGEMQPDPENRPSVSRGANDDYLVVLARQAGVDLVSGDPDLTVPGLAVRPREYLDELLGDG